ncbi:MAG: hypothetical protein OZ924_10520 [Burkholderiaceae bacterium]|nr:hypothetical protein [Burkholderiaceae bacterium]
MAREGIKRITVDLTTAQYEVLEQMLQKASATASEAAGLEIKATTRGFIHALLKQQAETFGLKWPADYPTAGGWRGG